MEDLTMTAVRVVATVVVGKILGAGWDALKDKVAKFLDSLKQVSPNTVTEIEQASEQPLDYRKAVLEIESAAKANSEVARRMEELAAAGKANPHPKFAEVIEKIEAALQSQQSKVENVNFSKIAEEIKAEKMGMVGSFNIKQQNNTF